MKRKPKNNPHLRDRDSRRYTKYELSGEFVRFVDCEVLPRVELRGYKQAEKQTVLRHATHNLVLTGLVGLVVADSRDNSDAPVRLRAGVWDALVTAGLAEQCRGSEVSGKVTRYAATGELLALRHWWELRMLMNVELSRNTQLSSPTDRALVCLHTGRRDVTGELLPKDEQQQPISFDEHIAQQAQPGPDGKPHPIAIKNGMDYFRAKEDTIESINRSNMEHGWAATCTHPDGTTTTFQPNVCLRQIHVGEFFEAARLYSFGELSGQNLPREVRRTMRIDGEPVAEFDFSGMHPRMLYRSVCCKPAADPYAPEQVLPGCHAEPGIRGFIKRATNICFNSRGRPAAHSSISNALRGAGDIRRMVEAEVGDVVALVDRLLEVHAPIAEYFFSGVGMELMTADGQVMLAIMCAFRDARKPALPIHDSVVCRASDAEFAEETMAHFYRVMLCHEPVINRKL